MKTRIDRLECRLVLRAVAVITSGLLLAATQAKAATATPFTSTGWLTGVPVPPVLVTNALGQVLIRGNVQTVMVQSSDPRLTGRRLVFMDGAYQADGSALIQGTAYQEVGTWDLADPQNPRFTPTGGLWEIRYQGTTRSDNSLQVHVAGHGSGGSIEGLRIEEDVTRAAGSMMDPAIPCQYTGILQPPPVNSVVVLDNFDDNKVRGWNIIGAAKLIETNQQMTMRGYWPGIRTEDIVDTIVAADVKKTWRVEEGQTLEWRVDLVRMGDYATAAILEPWTTAGAYVLFKGRDFIHLCKYSGTHAHFIHDKALVKNSNVVLSLAMTGITPNLLLTVRILDKANGDAVLYERSVVDTPGVDRTLTRAEVEAVSGMRLMAGSDLGGPYVSGGYAVTLDVWQYNPNGTLPAAEVTYDNLELRTYEVPPVGIERAVRLSWPASAENSYVVEGAPAALGPWLPIQDVSIPGMKQLSVPITDLNRFFRLQKAP